MNQERERFISEEDDELKYIREANLRRMERKRGMHSKPVHITDSNFNKVVKEHPLALIDFWASWCGPCLALAPTVEELAVEHAEKVFVGKLDVDENPATATAFQVFSIPTLVIMKNGKEVDRIVGCVPKENIETALNRHMV